jgi:ribokinase
MFDVAVVGAPFLDLTFEGLPRLPEVGEEVVARALHMTPGGTGMHAIGCARLGLSTALVAPMGDGGAAQLVAGVLEAQGVHIARPERTAEPDVHGVPVTALLAMPNGVAMVTAAEAAEPRRADVARIRSRALLTSLGRLDLAPPGAAVYAITGGLELARVDATTFARLRGARALLLNAAEAVALTGRGDVEGAARELARHAEVAVVTRGHEGAAAAAGERVFHAPAPRTDVVDATGAGDLFAAAYIWADLRGAPLEERVRWAALYASLSVRAPTALAGALSLAELLSEGRTRGLAPPPG